MYADAIYEQCEREAGKHRHGAIVSSGGFAARGPCRYEMDLDHPPFLARGPRLFQPTAQWTTALVRSGHSPRLL